MKYVKLLYFLVAFTVFIYSNTAIATNAVTREPDESVSNACVPFMPTPKYPAQELRDGISGIVRLAIKIDEAGEIMDMYVRHSSGSKNLDDAALSKARTWRLCPMLKDGVPKGGWLFTSVTFEL